MFGNDWDRYQAQQATYNLMRIALRPKFILLWFLIGLCLNFFVSTNNKTSTNSHAVQTSLPITQAKTK